MADTSAFTGLITSEHADKPNFVQTVAVSVQAWADQIALAAGFPDYFNLTEAVGVQLDAIGLWVGISRYVALTINQYFSWDTPGLGWDQGIWWVVGDATQQVTTLSDGDYRQVIAAKILCNSWDGSLPGAVEIVAAALGVSASAVTIGEGAMTATIAVSSSVSPTLQAVLTNGYLPLKPVGVSITYAFTSGQFGSELGNFVIGANTVE